jgi:hypothetical protein
MIFIICIFVDLHNKSISVLRQFWAADCVNDDVEPVTVSNDDIDAYLASLQDLLFI